MTIIDEAQARLEQLAVKHVPFREFLPSGPADTCIINSRGKLQDTKGERAVILSDPPGVYYLLDSDNDGAARKSGIRQIQLTFLEVPEHAVHYVEQLGAGWRLDKVELLPAVGKEGHPGVWSAILSHVD
jgi:hypothetical protein